jgi:hypothetical protein
MKLMQKDMDMQRLTNVISITALAIALLALAARGTEQAQANSLIGSISPQGALGLGFTYQGYLTRSGTPINGQDQCDMRFTLWDAASAGAQIGNLQATNGVDFTNGSFTATLNEAGQFGTNAFSGEARWLQIELACPSGSSSYTSMGRQAITAVPYALHSMSTGGLQGRSISTTAPSTGQMLKWDGSAWSPANAYARTVVVSPADTPTASGARLLTALQAINDATADKPYLLKIEPGVYDLGTTSLQMKPYVDIEGSGARVTILTGLGGPEDGKAVVFGTNNVELRQITVQVNATDVPFTAAIRNTSASPRLTDIDVRVTAPTGAGNQVFGIANQNGSSPHLHRVTVLMRGGNRIYGLYNAVDSSPTVINSHLDVGAGYYGETIRNQTRSSPTIQYSTIIGTDSTGYSWGIRAQDGSNVRVYNSVINAVPPVGSYGLEANTIYVANSIVESRGSLNPGGGNKCVSSFNTQLVAVNGSCQLL